MNLILLGPPGCGKGTQGERLERSRGMVPLSTGNMLRAAIAKATPLGKKVKNIIDSGNLVSDDIIISLIGKRVSEPDCDRGFILDGCPRTVGQAEGLDRILAEKGLKIDCVIELRAQDEALIDRISGRYACADCGAGYHDRNKQPKVGGVCDVCGGVAFTRRDDDKAEVVGARVATYHKETEQLLPYYQARDLLNTVDALAPIDTVSSKIESILAACKRD